MSPALEAAGISVDLRTESGPPRRVLDAVSFTIPEAGIVGLFGESGCGKTTLALSLLGLLPERRYRVRGSVRLRGQELLGLSESRWRQVRGAAISLVFQDPALALNPVARVGWQVQEAGRAHGLAIDTGELLEMVRLPGAPRIARSYPHQLSGGERQRVAMAQALACRPAVVIADEPFTALDAVTALELATLFEDLRERTGTSFLLISHSPGVLARIADAVLVMHAGSVVEQGAPGQVFGAPSHPYTAGVLDALARLRGADEP